MSKGPQDEKSECEHMPGLESDTPVPGNPALNLTLRPYEASCELFTSELDPCDAPPKKKAKQERAIFEIEVPCLFFGVTFGEDAVLSKQPRLCPSCKKCAVSAPSAESNKTTKNGRDSLADAVSSETLSRASSRPAIMLLNVELHRAYEDATRKSQSESQRRVTYRGSLVL
ncbi:hypothetical protein MRX96_040809 [Rhipicephalus microplus]